MLLFILRSKVLERKVEFDDDGGGVELELQGNEGVLVGYVYDSGGVVVEWGGGVLIVSGGVFVVGGGKWKWFNLVRVGSLRNC